MYDNHELYSWGLQGPNLGLPNRKDEIIYYPDLVESTSPLKLIAIAVGRQHVLVLDKHGEVFAWGAGTCGQTGQGHKETLMLPQRVNKLRGHKIISIGCGLDHSVALSRTHFPPLPVLFLSIVLTPQSTPSIHGCQRTAEYGLGDYLWTASWGLAIFKRICLKPER